jgi:DNA-binding NarL/FixJ family response regulator
MTSRINIILADDHRIFRDGLKSLLTEHDDLRIIGEASDGLELMALLIKLKPDLVIMDITMPSLSGIEVATRITDQYPDIRILMLSMHTHEEYVVNAIKKRGKYSGTLQNIKPIKNYLNILFHD